MNLNADKIMRFGPFFVVSYFAFQSILNYSFKGIIYLIGLLFAFILICIIPKSLLDRITANTNTPKDICFETSLLKSDSENKFISNVPFGILTYTYTFFYLFIFIFYAASKDDTGLTHGHTEVKITSSLTQNIPIFIIFPLFLAWEIYWQYNNQCTTVVSICLSFFIGAIIGVLWAILITYSKDEKMMFLSKTDVDVCSRPSKTYFSCKKV